MTDIDLDQVTVRVMQPGEFEIVKAVSVAAFGDEPSIAVLLDALQASWAWRPELSFVAELAGEIVGQVLYTGAILDAPEQLVDVLVLSPVGIRPDLQRVGIGTKLITESLAAVASRPEPAVFLEGSPAYYPRFGFVPGRELGFNRPSERIPEPAFQVHPLANFTDELRGTLVYPDAFWRTDSVGLR